jgi:long-chain fatty acid transport protein
MKLSPLVRSASIWGASAFVSLALLGSTTDAFAGGLYFAERGVRAGGRGGAMVAGADDLSAVWFNPAGMHDAGTSILVDAAWLNYSSEFQRRTQVVDATQTVRVYEYPKVEGATPFLPIPTLAFGVRFGPNVPQSEEDKTADAKPEKQFAAGMSVLAPMAPLPTYPTTVDGRPSPSRYSLISMNGSALLFVGAHIAWKPIPQLRIGASAQLLAGSFKSTLMLSANPADRLIGSPEDPQYDTLTELDAKPIVAPSGALGVIYEPLKMLRFGLSGQLPVWVNAPASNKVRLPTSPLFDRAKQEGDAVRVKFRLPAILRAGVEFRHKVREKDEIRAEFAYVREFWSLHDSIEIRPDGLALTGITGFPSPFSIPVIRLPRNFQDSNSFRLGGEYTLPVSAENKLTIRVGVSYETSAVPKEYLSVLTIDANKVTPGLGASFHLGSHLRLDATYQRVIAFSTDVAPSEAAISRVNPVVGSPAPSEAINGGRYSAGANVLGLGMNYAF